MAQPTLTKQELTTDQTKYIKRDEMEEVLRKTFGAGLDFNVSTKGGRWIYYANRKLTGREVRDWIATLEKRRKAEEKARKARADDGTGSVGASSGGRVI